MSAFVDKILTCVESSCNLQFVWTAGEQEFFQKQNFTAEPKRCKACREKRKTARGGAPESPTQRRGNHVVVKQGFPEDDEDRGNRRRRR